MYFNKQQGLHFGTTHPFRNWSVFDHLMKTKIHCSGMPPSAVMSELHWPPAGELALKQLKKHHVTLWFPALCLCLLQDPKSMWPTSSVPPLALDALEDQLQIYWPPAGTLALIKQPKKHHATLCILARYLCLLRDLKGIWPTLSDPPLALDTLEDQLQVWHCPHLGFKSPSMICWCLMSARHIMIARLEKVHEVAQGLGRPLFASYLACLVQQSFTSMSAEPSGIALSGGICHPSLGSSWLGLGVAQALPFKLETVASKCHPACLRHLTPSPLGSPLSRATSMAQYISFQTATTIPNLLWLP